MREMSQQGYGTLLIAEGTLGSVPGTALQPFPINDAALAKQRRNTANALRNVVDQAIGEVVSIDDLRAAVAQ